MIVNSIKGMISSMLNNRLNEITQTENPPLFMLQLMTECFCC